MALHTHGPTVARAPKKKLKKKKRAVRKTRFDNAARPARSRRRR